MIVLLVLAWTVVLAPAILKPRFEASPIDGVREFERTLGILASTRHGTPVPGRWVMVPKDLPHAPRRRRQRVVARRRRAFTRLVAAAGATLIIGLAPGLHAVLWFHLALDAALVGYVWQLRRWRIAEVERARVLRPLHPERTAAVGTDEPEQADVVGG